MSIARSVSVLVLALAAPLAFAGCASDEPAAPPADQGAETGPEDDLTGAASATLKATPVKRTIAGANGATCSYDLVEVQVENLSAKARTAINALLSVTPGAKEEQSCKEYEGSYEVEGGAPEPTVNEGGVLSIAYAQSEFAEQAAHPNNWIKPINVSLSTGAPIRLGALVDEGGKKLLVQACGAAIAKALEEEGADAAAGYESYCEYAAGDDANEFAITATGLSLLPSNQLPHAIAAAGYGEGFEVSWTALGTHLAAKSAVRKLAGR